MLWIFRLDNDCAFDIRKHLPADWNSTVTFTDQDHTPRLRIGADGVATVLATYAWNGCSPKFNVLDITVGTPDGVPMETGAPPKTYSASLFHDALYQFLDDPRMPLSRKQADDVFLELLTRDGFALRHVYYTAVRLFGGIARHL